MLMTMPNKNIKYKLNNWYQWQIKILKHNEKAERLLISCNYENIINYCRQESKNNNIYKVVLLTTSGNSIVNIGFDKGIYFKNGVINYYNDERMID